MEERCNEAVVAFDDEQLLHSQARQSALMGEMAQSAPRLSACIDYNVFHRQIIHSLNTPREEVLLRQPAAEVKPADRRRHLGMDR